MGKGEEKTVEQEGGKQTDTPDEPIEEKVDPESGEEKKSASPVEEVKTGEATTDDAEKDKDSIRKIIKFESAGESEKEEKKPDAPGEKKDEILEDDESEVPSRKTLEQKRAILQSIKDFDFQIKKNQEDISGLNQKLDTLSKDLDDLVSLYEIVSEQMNPFVGLSKVTKKRIDALENFTKEIDTLKMRMGELESFAERAGVKIESYEDQGGESPAPKPTKTTQELSDKDLDKIIEKALTMLSADDKIDMKIDEFIEELKNENTNG